MGRRGGDRISKSSYLLRSMRATQGSQNKQTALGFHQLLPKLSGAISQDALESESTEARD